MTVLMKKEDGFTLIEVLISIGILAIVGSFLCSSLAISYQTNTTTEDRAIANNLAIEKMEEIKASSWSNINSQSLTNVSGYSTFQSRVDVVNNTNPQTKQVTVGLYKAGNNQALVQLTTLLSQAGR